VNDHPYRVGALLCSFVLAACSAPTAAAPAPQTRQQLEPSVVGKRSADAADDCAEVPGQPPPEPLRAPFSGVAKAARCQREVYTIMGGVTHFLGVECKHCHQEPDYTADTHNKRIANWMAKELVPRLLERGGDAVWCRDCHAGRAKFLGSPRRPELAVEWMLTHMVEDFQTNRGLPPKCKDCHGGDLGSADFRPKIILSPLAAPPLVDAPAAPSASSAPAPLPVPDFGGR
jgi:Cytochrome c7 and related cytochrome c